jgi:hypothetical protein
MEIHGCPMDMISLWDAQLLEDQLEGCKKFIPLLSATVMIRSG